MQLRPLEAASRLHATEDPRLFKRRLDEDELQLLHTLGVIAQPRPRYYFRDTWAASPGLRPSRDLALAVHYVIDVESGERIESLVDPAIGAMLHYESHNGDEFVRKWLALLDSGQRGPAAQATRAPAPGRSPPCSAWACPRRRPATSWSSCSCARASTTSRRCRGWDCWSRSTPTRESAVRARPSRTSPQLRELLDRAYDAPKQVFRPRKQGPRTAKVVARLQRGLR